jgi:hypothetical protein
MQLKDVVILVGCLGFLAFSATLVAMVFTILTYKQTRTAAPCTGGSGGGSTTLVVSSLCDDSNVCTVDLLDATLGTCVNPNAVSGAACASLCWDDTETTTCNGRGTCGSSNLSACKGMCRVNTSFVDFGSWHAIEAGLVEENARTLGCDIFTFPLKFYYFQPVNFTDMALVPSLFNFGIPVCYGQVCSFVFLTITGGMFQSTSKKRETWHPVVTTHTVFPCSEILDDTVPGYDVNCIVSREVPIDAHLLTNYMTYLFEGSASNEIPTDAFNQTYMGRFCTFHYACARTNATIYLDPANRNGHKRVLSPGAQETTGVPAHVLHSMLPGILDEQFRRKRKRAE